MKNRIRNVALSIITGLSLMCTPVASMAEDTVESIESSSSTVSYIKGDIDGDGSINTNDALMVQYFMNGRIMPTNAQLMRMDFDGDYIISDASNYILGYLANPDNTHGYKFGESTKGNPDEYNITENYDVTYVSRICGKDTLEQPYVLHKNNNINNISTYSLLSNKYDDEILDTNNTGCVYVEADEYAGSGFIVSPHVIATAAHVVVHNNTIDKNVSIKTTVDNNSELLGSTEYIPVKSVHIPQSYLNNTDYTPINDYALLYVEEDLSKYGIYNLAVTPDNFSNYYGASLSNNTFDFSNSMFVMCTGFLTNESTIATERYHSIGKLLNYPYNDDPKKVLYHNAHLYRGKSGGPLSTYTIDGGKPKIEFVIGINSGFGDVYYTNVNNITLNMKITPNLLHFYFNNNHLF